jgi:hypothetical protein
MWRDRAAERLDAAQETYGDSWASRSLDELLVEIAEELAGRLVAAAKCGTVGWVHIAQARERLRELEAGGSR